MAGLLQPAPFRVPLLDPQGQLVDVWKRFFLGAQVSINEIISVKNLGQPRPAMLSDDVSADVDNWIIPGPIGPQGTPGLPGIPGMDGLESDESWWLSGFPISSSNFVPYVGATQNVDLGTFTIKTPSVLFPLGSVLVEDALGQLALRQTTNPSVLFLYNTFTDTSNYEREFIGWSGNVFNITTNIAGSGVARGMLIGTNSLGNLDFKTNNVSRWEMTASRGDLIPFGDNVTDIGIAATNRPRSIYAGTFVITPIVQVDSVRSTAGSTFLDFYTNGVARWEMSTGNIVAFADNSYDLGASGANRPRTGYFGTSVVAPLFQTTTAIIAAGGGAAPTFTTIGGTGPATAAQNGWLQMTDSTGAAIFVPVWK